MRLGGLKEMESMGKNDLLTELNTALLFMKVGELKATCLKLNIPAKGQKPQLISNIISFLQTGTIPPPKSIPSKSKAQKGKNYPLAPDTLIVKGSYKNDADTRAFFKSLVGPHFHFTAFGQDWIKKKWMEGKPPTYREFADFWAKDYLARKNRKAEPKEEWAYLNFIQSYLAKHPNTHRQEMADAWKVYREEQAEQAQQLIESLLRTTD